jgi:hypothetical protein
VALYDLKPGDRVRTVDGSVSEVVAETKDGQWIRVRYVVSSERRLLGTDDLCHLDELRELVDVESSR